MAAAARWLDWLWLLACGLVGTALIVTASNRIGPTFDEPFYLRAGLERWRTGSTFELMRAGTMPLPIDVEMLAPYLVERVRGRPWDLASEFDAALGLARRGTLVFWWLTLIYGWRIAAGFGGPWAGRLAGAVLALEPTLLAHAGLATTDVALTATVLIFCHHYTAGRTAGWGRRVGLPALLYGSAILAKASGLVFVPICMVAIEFHRHWGASAAPACWPRLKASAGAMVSRSFVRESAVIFGLALVVTYAYCGSDWQAHPEIVKAAHALPDSGWRPAAVWLADHFRIFNNAGVGLCTQIKHNLCGHGVYLLGESSPRAIWYYFPIALSMKLPAPLLLAPFFLLAVARRSLFNWPFVAALLLLAFSLNCRVQIGVRMQLPLIVLLCIGLAIGLSSGVRVARPESSKGVAWTDHALRRLRACHPTVCAAVALLWLCTATLRAWPQHLSYINEFWGRPESGERLLSDSNFDWGQGVPELAEWARAHDMAELPLWYFGTDPAVNRPPFRIVPLHALEVANGEQLKAHVVGRYLAVSATLLYGSYMDRSGWLIDYLRRQTPAARTRTFFVFDLQPASGSGQTALGVGNGPSNSSKTPMRRNFW